MARDIGGGYYAVTERSFGRMSPPELDQVRFELDRLMREIRGDQPDLSDVKALQKRNRKIQRLNSALMILRACRQKRRR